MPKRALSRTPSVENNKRPRKHRYRPPKPSSASPMPPRTVNDLPLELLASILEHHKDVEPAKNLPLMLVCHRWRNCVETTPALWTEVSVHLRLSVYLNATKQIAAAVTKLDGYREHAGQVAMSVSVSAVEAYPNVIPADFRPLYDALGRFKGRIRSLTLGLHPIRLAALNELHTAHATLDLSNLQDLEIAATGEGRLDPPLAMFSTLPSLRSLCLQEMPLAFVLPPLVPWSQLTELTLSGYPSVDCMAPVSLAPNLTRLRVEAQPIEDDDDAPDRPENPVVLERLEDLEMYEAAGMQPRITDCFKFPNLRTVIVDATSYYRESDCRPPDPEADESDLDIIHPWDVQSLLSGKESKVHTVVLRTLWYSPWPAGVFHNIASVTELDVGPARRTFVQEFFRVFARYAFFPRLRRLTMRCTEEPDDGLPNQTNYDDSDDPIQSTLQRALERGLPAVLRKKAMGKSAIEFLRFISDGCWSEQYQFDELLMQTMEAEVQELQGMGVEVYVRSEDGRFRLF